MGSLRGEKPAPAWEQHWPRQLCRKSPDVDSISFPAPWACGMLSHFPPVQELKQHLPPPLVHHVQQRGWRWSWQDQCHSGCASSQQAQLEHLCTCCWAASIQDPRGGCCCCPEPCESPDGERACCRICSQLLGLGFIWVQSEDITQFPLVGEPQTH